MVVLDLLPSEMFMQARQSIGNEDSDVALVITAGCPYSGWEALLPGLIESGFNSSDEPFSDWLDEIYAAAGVTDWVNPVQSLKPNDVIERKATALFKRRYNAPLLWADNRNLWLLDFLASFIPDARFLLFNARAEYALGCAIERELDPNQYIESWCKASTVLTGFYRRNRHRTLLLDVEQSLNAPQALSNACQRIGVALKSNTSFVSVAPESLVLERMLAQRFLSGNQVVRSLQMELDASTYPLGEPVIEALPQPTDLYRSYLQLKNAIQKLTRECAGHEELAANNQLLYKESQRFRYQAESEVKEIRRENENLVIQLDQMQEELKASYLTIQEIEQIRKVGIEEKQKLQSRIEHLDKELGDSAELLAERAIDQQQLQVKMSALEQKLDEQAKLIDGDRVQEETNRQSKQQENADVRRLEKERELLLQQLQKMEEELEHYFLQYTELVKENEAKQQEKQEPDPESAQVSVAVVSNEAPTRKFTNPFGRTNKLQKTENVQIELLKKSGLFDEAWYLSQYSDVKEAGIDPVRHYLRYGSAEGRNPSREFDTKFYLERNSDVAMAGINPLLHYIRFGRDEGRLPSKR